MKKIKTEIKNLYPLLEAFREDLHQHPELSWKEFRTTEKIEEILRGDGLSNFQRPLETGGYIDFHLKDKAPYLLFRADIDALPIQDRKKKPYSSKNNGVLHACGHDMHATIILGLALLIHKLDVELPFNLRFVFQPAEEVIPNGAEKMLNAGILNNVKYAFGIHVEPRLKFGVVSLTPGWVNMQSVRIDIKLSGSGGHSAYPHKCPDLIWIASRIIQDCYQMIYREVDILNAPAVLSFTGIQAGEGYNIFPSRLNLAGTFRNADSKIKKQFFQKLSRLTDLIADETGAKIEVTLYEGAPPVMNDPNLIQKLQENAKSFDEITEIVTDFRSPGGDDFGSYCQKVSSALVRFGFAKEGYTSLLHTDTFDVPPELIKSAVTFLGQQVLNFKL
jgi:amidohydrolase